jgi:hypothetical protein
VQVLIEKRHNTLALRIRLIERRNCSLGKDKELYEKIVAHIRMANNYTPKSGRMVPEIPADLEQVDPIFTLPKK